MFLFPKKLIRKIDALLSQFLWNGSKHGKRNPTIAWNIVCRSKARGRLGIRNFETWNAVVVLKQLWAIDQKKRQTLVKMGSCVLNKK